MSKCGYSKSGIKFKSIEEIIVIRVYRSWVKTHEFELGEYHCLKYNIHGYYHGKRKDSLNRL